jgi:hypothetical protein
MSHSRTSPVALLPISTHGDATMGDKSPKSMRKQADQKQTKTDQDNRSKQAAQTAKKAPAKKK